MDLPSGIAKIKGFLKIFPPLAAGLLLLGWGMAWKGNLAIVFLSAGLVIVGLLAWYLADLRLRREMAIRKLTENEEKLNTITGAVQDAIVMVDESGRAVFWNRAAEQIFGYRADEIMGRDIHDYIAPEASRPFAVGGLKKFSASGDGRLFSGVREVEARRKDGSRFPAEVNLSPVRVADRWCAVGVVRDVTGKTEAEQDLVESETRYNLAVSGISAGLWDWFDVNGEGEWWSPKFYELLGYEDREIEASLPNFRELLHPDDQDRTFSAVQAHFKDNLPFMIEYRLKTKKLGYRWFLGSGQVQRDSDGKPLRMVGSIADIHERRMAEDRARENEAKFRALFDHSFQFTGLLSPDGVMIEANRTALDFGGFEMDGVRGRKLWETPWWPDSRETIRDLKDAVARAAQGEFIRKEMDIQGAGERILTIDFSIKPVVDENGRVVLLIPEGRDISDRKASEKALASSELQLKYFVKHTPAAVAMFDREIRYLVASDRWYTDYGLQGREIIGLSHYEIFPEIDNMEDWKAIHQRCLAGEVMRRDEEAFPRADRKGGLAAMGGAALDRDRWPDWWNHHVHRSDHRAQAERGGDFPAGSNPGAGAGSGGDHRSGGRHYPLEQGGRKNCTAIPPPR